MLTMNRKRIITEKDFFDHFDSDELLKQKEDFWIFAKNNWFFMAPARVARHCYHIYQSAIQRKFKLEPKEWRAIYNPDFQLENISPEYSISRQQSNCLEELFYSYKTKGNYGWYNKYYADAAVLLLAFVHMNRFGLTDPNKPCANPKQERGDFMILNGYRNQVETRIINGALCTETRCLYDPQYILKSEDQIKSREIRAKSEGVVFQLISATDRKTVLWEKALEKNECVWVNTVGDVVVSVIENQFLTDGDKRLQLPDGAYSIVEVSPNLFVYLLDGKLQQTSTTSRLDERWYSYRESYVELSLINGRVYLLTEHGDVYTKRQEILEKTVSLKRLRR